MEIIENIVKEHSPTGRPEDFKDQIILVNNANECRDYVGSMHSTPPGKPVRDSQGHIKHREAWLGAELTPWAIEETKKFTAYCARFEHGRFGIPWTW